MSQTFYTNTTFWETLNFQSVQHSCQSPVVSPKWAPCGQCEVCSSSALLSLIQGLVDAVTSLMHQTCGASLVSPTTGDSVSLGRWEMMCQSAPLETELWLPREKHPQRAKEGFWAAAKLIPALISTKTNPKLCDRCREAHQHLKPDTTEIPLPLHTAAPSLWTWHALPGMHLAWGLWSLSSIPL